MNFLQIIFYRNYSCIIRTPKFGLCSCCEKIPCQMTNYAHIHCLVLGRIQQALMNVNRFIFFFLCRKWDTNLQFLLTFMTELILADYRSALICSNLKEKYVWFAGCFSSYKYTTIFVIGIGNFNTFFGC